MIGNFINRDVANLASVSIVCSTNDDITRIETGALPEPPATQAVYSGLASTAPGETYTLTLNANLPWLDDTEEPPPSFRCQCGGEVRKKGQICKRCQRERVRRSMFRGFDKSKNWRS